jgi:UDP-3-O-[3-hydroxymyristoyl] glucosamine N-acyltransferase
MSVNLRDLLPAMAMPYRVVGVEEREVTGAAPITNASAASVTFCSRTGAEADALIAASAAGVIVCGETESAPPEKTLVIVPDPRLAFLRIVAAAFSPRVQPGIHPTAVIDPLATIGGGVHIGPFTSIDAECEVGEDTIIHGHVHVYAKTRIGRRVSIHAGTVIGADGYGYQRNSAGELEKFPHIGGVVIEDDVEIGSNTSIDRGTLGDTVIRRGARIDNLVHIAHNVVVGEHAAVIANAMIGGSTVIGDGAWIAPGACVRDGLTIGAKAVVGLGAVVVKDVPAGATVLGNPARQYEKNR